MAELLQETEATPSGYPATPSGLSTAAAALDADMIWQRIEAYTRTRYATREVVWTIEGVEDEDWLPPLGPVTSQTAERWETDAWSSVTLADGPVGLCLPTDGIYRITADVGGGDVPAAVSEAFRRLAEFMAETDDRPGASQYSVNMGGAIQESYTRSASHAARALHNSGAADLLRPYRRQK